MEAGKSRLDTVRELEDDGISLSRRCELLQVNRSSFYYRPAIQEPPADTEESLAAAQAFLKRKEEVMAIIDEVHTDLPASGARKIAKELQKRGYTEMTRYKTAKLMEEMNVKTCYPHPNLSKPGKGHPKFPYLLKNKKIWIPNQVWAIDVTYVACGRSHMYLTAIIDWYSRMVVGWMLADTLELEPVIECVRQAITQYGVPCCINSDQGVHFTSNAYVELLKFHGIRQSMDGKGRWIDNRIIERWFRSLKSEHLRIIEYSTPRELRYEVDEFVVKYNERRLHESLDYITPKECYEAAFKAAA